MSDHTEQPADGVAYGTQVRQHVWESLVSMLRVYAHAASLNGKAFDVADHSGTASLKCQDCVLALDFHPETGEATWRMKQPESETWGEFRIEEDGTLNFPAGPKPLDTAAIDWVEHVVHATTPAEHVGHPLGIS